MSLKKMLLPAALIAMIALLAPRANAQTMGEYATTTAGAAGGGESMAPSFSLPSPISPSGTGGSGGSGTWAVSRLGASFEERAAAVSGSGMGADFESRAGALTSGHADESRWPGTGISSAASQNRFGGTSDRFSTGDRFATNERFTSENRFPESEFKDHMGLDTGYNAINP